MAKNILKEAIADAKAVREVALANAKAALEEAFTPKLQSMLSAKLSETLNEEEDELDENKHDEETMDEITGMDEKDDMDENYGMEEKEDLDEEIDLEEILNELELEEEDDSEQEDVEATDDEALDKEMEEAVGYPNHRADQVQKVRADATDINQGLNEGGEFDLDALLEEINNLDEDTVDEYGSMSQEEDVSEWSFNSVKSAPDKTFSNQLRAFIKDSSSYEDWQSKVKEFWTKGAEEKRPGWPSATAAAAMIKSPHWREEYETNKTQAAEEGVYEALETELAETQAALEVKTTELNEVNLLNSKLLYVNRIFKANQLDQGQKLRVVETLDKADSIKEAKLIYETIKDTFNVAKSKKASFQKRTKSLKEGIGMASKAAGTSTAKKEVIAESGNMVSRFQKLANIKINQ